MNIYYVCSELLSDQYSQYEPPEPYRICAIVAARTKSQASLLAWKESNLSFSGSVTEKPRFTHRKLGEVLDVNTLPRVLHSEMESAGWWALVGKMGFSHP